MPVPLVYKARERNPRGYVKGELTKALPTKQWAHKYVLYMGRREGVVKNEDMEHGLFGKLNHNNDGELGAIENVSAAADYVKSKVEAGTYLYDNIISIAKEDFMRLGYDTQDAWKRLVKANIHKIAEKVDIPPSKLEYVAAVHIENEKPNFHLLFWSKEQGVKSHFDYKKTFNSIRSELIKYVYDGELQEIATVKNLAREHVTSATGEFIKGFFHPLREMSKAEFQSLMDKLEENPEAAIGKLLNRDVPNSMLDEFAVKIMGLKEKLPTTGRLSYAFLSPELKKETEDIVRSLLKVHPDFKEEFDEYKKINKTLAPHNAYEAYKKSSGDLASYYSSQAEAIKKAEQKAEAEIIKRMSNLLLKEIKNFNRDLDTKAAQRTMSVSVMSSLFRLLSRFTRSSSVRAAHLPIGKTDRIEARKDLRRNLEHSSGWNR